MREYGYDLTSATNSILWLANNEANASNEWFEWPIVQIAPRVMFREQDRSTSGRSRATKKPRMASRQSSSTTHKYLPADRSRMVVRLGA
jgi:hypothetical protein